MDIGDGVIYCDEFGRDHAAIVTSKFGEGDNHGCNVAFVSSDTNRTDTYGRQIERATSVVHQAVQSAHGNYWRRVDEQRKSE